METKQGTSICRNPQCGGNFKPLHKRHFFCCDKCKYTYHNCTETRKKTVEKYNRTEKASARTKRFLSTEKGKIYNREKQARQRKRYPDRCEARMIAHKNLPVFLPCSVSRCNEKGERHHPDHSKPLEVVYLCKKHHVEAHYGTERVLVNS